jgi:hypothetical protein
MPLRTPLRANYLAARTFARRFAIYTRMYSLYRSGFPFRQSYTRCTSMLGLVRRLVVLLVVSAGLVKHLCDLPTSAKFAPQSGQRISY